MNEGTRGSIYPQEILTSVKAVACPPNTGHSPNVLGECPVFAG